MIFFKKTAILKIGSRENTDAKLIMKRSFLWDDPPICTLGTAISVNYKKKAVDKLVPMVDIVKSKLASVADPGFPRGGVPTYNFAKISRKLHEIERIWTPGGRIPRAPPPPPPKSTNEHMVSQKN